MLSESVSAAPFLPAQSIASSCDEAFATAGAEMAKGNWDVAAKNFLRIRDELKGKTPRQVYAHAATCLHKLGRYAEAEQLSLEGLGDQRDMIAIKGTVPSEKELTRDWPRNAAPAVSIICTTFNHERYIEGTIRGFLSQQTKFSFEILIHDDASTDGTARIIRAWQEKYPSVIRTILQKENQLSRGVRPFDLMLKEARGTYIAGCEGDDYWILPTKLEQQVGFLAQHPDFSCSAHNHYLYEEAHLFVRPWLQTRRDLALSERQVMNLTRLLWFQTLVFRKTFSAFPPERAFAVTTDFVLTSYLGTFGKCAYFESFLGSVRRQNQYSCWTPMAEEKKNYSRVKTWLALVRMHENRGNHDVANDLLKKIEAIPLNVTQKFALFEQSLELRKPQPPSTA
jgi:glycosyltransferase involved in cell wall biosynthesis